MRGSRKRHNSTTKFGDTGILFNCLFVFKYPSIKVVKASSNGFLIIKDLLLKFAKRIINAIFFIDKKFFLRQTTGFFIAGEINILSVHVGFNSGDPFIQVIECGSSNFLVLNNICENVGRKCGD